ncbi:hypothetical protein GON01_02120 [Sphingomonas sp. MAH-20]|jgi:hypothetical protein|uniref:Uncharacterized protein n=1 Tax=Sphingomonas horti TaxID=2682842 RepID=A0A6I4IX89_9SPHN|nr:MULTISPECIES: hypothetical protein [Sphingomonas]MBA2920485.1 hypothetical protein [Sphingomonas sp. CGMCC 1.13658]MVO76737.1 hypothetical protein [Sphingomonas horti]
MKLVLIVLAIIAAAFVAVVVYGANRDDTATTSSSGAAPPMRGGDLDEDAVEGWEAPELGPFLGSLTRRFTPPVEVRDPEVSVGGLLPQTRHVDASKDKLRVARLVLVAGRSARIKASQPGPDGKPLCLCRPHMPIVESDFAGCSDRWLATQRKENCKEGADEGTLVFKQAGGDLVFTGAEPARVRVAGRKD